MGGSGSPLQVRTTVGADEVRIVASGALTLDAVTQLRDALTAVAAERRVVLDLRGATGFDFTAAVLVRDARVGRRGLPVTEVLLDRATMIMLVAAGGG